MMLHKQIRKLLKEKHQIEPKCAECKSEDVYVLVLEFTDVAGWVCDRCLAKKVKPIGTGR